VFKYILSDDGDQELWSMVETITGTICDQKIKTDGAMGPFMDKSSPEIVCEIPSPQNTSEWCSSKAPTAERICWCVGEVPETTPAPVPVSTCNVFGDPHIVGFDKGTTKLLSLFGPQTTFLQPGDFWLVKSKHVHIQGRYQNNMKSKGSIMMYLAVGGPFLQGHRLIIGPTIKGAVNWFTGKEKEEIVSSIPSHFGLKHLIRANATNVPLIAAKNMTVLEHTEETMPGVIVDLPLNVNLIVNRFPRALSVRITMPRLPDQDGQCGNFNGNPNDDTAELIMERMGGWTIHEEQLAFEHPMSYYENRWTLDDWENRVKSLPRTSWLTVVAVPHSPVKIRLP